MSIASTLWSLMRSILAKLPVEVQKQRSKKVAKTIPLEQELFIGMWSKRTDMQDSAAWVRDLRNWEWPI